MASLIVTIGGKWQTPSSIPPSAYAALTLSGIGTGLSWLCYFRALQLGDASRVAPVDKLSVVFIAIIAAAALGERLAPVNWLGVAFISTGAILVSLPR